MGSTEVEREPRGRETPEEAAPRETRKPDRERVEAKVAGEAREREAKVEAERIARALAEGSERADEPLAADFSGAERDEGSRLVLDASTQTELRKKVAAETKRHRFSLPSLAVGAPTATEYESKARNFSTRTSIMELEDGRKAFAIYNYPTSWIHRALDGVSKRLAGTRMRKADSADWKRTYEARSEIPVIRNEDPNVVLLPYIENVNAYDLFANNKEIKDFGACEWAEEVTLDDKLALADRIVAELARVHESGRTWGETILPNMILTKDQRPVIVDPETIYDADVPEKEQRARDLKDLTISVCGALAKSESIKDFGLVVKRVLDAYPDRKVVEEARKLAAKEPSFIEGILQRTYETARLGISHPDLRQVLEEIAISPG